MHHMQYADLELTPDQYAQYRYRGCPFLLQLATHMGLTISSDQLEQDLLFFLLAFRTQPRLRLRFFSRLIVIYYFHHMKGLPLHTLFQRFHIPTSAVNMQYYHRLCELKDPAETRITRRCTELKLYLESISQHFHLSEECFEVITKLCYLLQVQHYIPRHLVAGAVLYIKPRFHLNEISILDLAVWAHCCSTTLIHLRESFCNISFPSRNVSSSISGEVDLAYKTLRYTRVGKADK